jgi:hypothetical protein
MERRRLHELTWHLEPLDRGDAVLLTLRGVYRPSSASAELGGERRYRK